mgnify:CR=1 FL=1
MLLSLKLSKVSLILGRLHSLLFYQRNLLSQDFVLLKRDRINIKILQVYEFELPVALLD